MAGFDLLIARVQDIFAIDIADAGRADRAHEGHARERHRSRGRNHRKDVGLILAIIGENLRDAVDLVVEAFGKQRPQRPVDQAGNQSFLFGGPAFALEKAAGNAPGREIFFLVVDGQREEILAFLDRLCRGNRAENDRFAERRDDRAVSLAGNLARFECQGLSAPLE